MLVCEAKARYVVSKTTLPKKKTKNSILIAGDQQDQHVVF